ncbi:MAG TPA: helix-turn-helix domain-containing protein [Terriglobales bacterium]|nr:helix-turn-helix domain-containing protein [Terriglobales bacterium]
MASRSGRVTIVPIAELEREAIQDALRQTKGDMLTAARLLGIGKTTMYRKVAQYERQKGKKSGRKKK